MFLVYILSSLLAMYFAGIGNAQALSFPSFLRCFCWDMCQISFPQNLIIIGVESIAAFILFKHLLKFSLKKSILFAGGFSFIFVYIVDGLYLFTELLDIIWQLNIYGVDYPLHVAFGRIFVIAVLLVVILISIRKRIIISQ